MSWVVPGLVNSLGRSTWKTLKATPFFLLQKNEPSRTVKKPPRPYRVVTARFPHYKIAEADDAESLMDAMSFLTHNILPQVEGKKSSKQVAKWLKLWHAGLVKIDYNLGSKDDEEGHDDIFTSADETDGESEDCVPAKTSPSNRTWYNHRKQRHTNATERAPGGPLDPLPLRFPANETENAFPLSLFANRRKSEGTKDPYPLHVARSAPLVYENGSERGSGSHVDTPTEGNDSSASLSGEREVTARERATEFPNHQRTRSDTSTTKVKSRPRTTSLPTAPSVPFRSTTDFSPLPEHTTWSAWANLPLESFQQWVRMPPDAMGATFARNTALGAAVATTVPNKNTNRARAQENLTFFEIPFHFVALLSYPEDDTLPGSRPPFHILREIALVRQRRMVLMGLTLFTLLLRLSSPDFFCVLLALCNWVGLYLLKNSRKVNVTLAKRSVRQRVGWAKQWANGLFWRRGQAQLNNSTVNTSNIAPPAKQGTGLSNHQLNEEKTKGYVVNTQGNLHGGLRPPSENPGKSSANPNPITHRLTLRSGISQGNRIGHNFDAVLETTGTKSRFNVYGHPSYYTTDGLKTRSAVAVNEPPTSPPYEFPLTSANQRIGQHSAPSTPTYCVPGTIPLAVSSSASTCSSPGAGPQTDIPANPSTSTRRGVFFRKAVETKHIQLVPSVPVPYSNVTETATARPSSPPWSDINSTSTVNLSATPLTAPHDFLSDPTMAASTWTAKRRFFLSRKNTIKKSLPFRNTSTGTDPTMPDIVGKNLELSDFPSSANLGRPVSAIQENGGEVHCDGERQENESESGIRRESLKSLKSKEKERRSVGLWRLRRSSLGSSPDRHDLYPLSASAATHITSPRQLQVVVPIREGEITGVDEKNRNRVPTDFFETESNIDNEGELKSELSPTISGLGIRLAVDATENTPDSDHSRQVHPEI